MQALHPREFGLKHIKSISSGEFHSFAIDEDGRVMAWGLNQFGQCGIPSQGGEDGAIVSGPTYVDALDGKNIIQIAGGEHHSIALSNTGEIYTFGRLDSFEAGFAKGELPESAVKDESGRARYVPVPSLISTSKFPKWKYVCCGSHHSVALDVDGSAWSWGFGETYQVGQGPEGDDIEVPTKIENTASKGVNMVFAGAGGQFTVLAGIPPSS